MKEGAQANGWGRAGTSLLKQPRLGGEAHWETLSAGAELDFLGRAV